MEKFISYSLTSNEQKIMKDVQKQTLLNFSQYLNAMKFQNLWEIFYASSIMILSGYFSDNKKLTRDPYYPYVYITGVPNMFYCMKGVGCCRHVNDLLKEIFLYNGFQVIDLPCILGKDKEINHLVVGVPTKKALLLFDAYNERIFQAFQNGGFSHQGFESVTLDENTYSKRIIQELYIKIEREERIDLNQLAKYGDDVYKRIIKDSQNRHNFYELTKPQMVKVRKIYSKYEYLKSIGARAYE